MSLNKDFPLDYIQPFLTSFGLFKLSRVYFFDDISSTFRKYWPLPIMIACSAFFYVSLIKEFVHLVGKSDNYINLVNTLPVVIVATQAVIKVIVILANKAKIMYTVKELAKLWPEEENLEESNIHLKNQHMRRLKKFNTIYYWINIGGMWQYCLTPLLEVLFRRMILKQDAELRLPFECSYPFDPTEAWPRYLLVYFSQTFGIIKLIYIFLGCEILVITFSAHLSTLFTHLRYDILHVTPEIATKTISGNYEDDTYSDDIIKIEEHKKKYELRELIKRHQTLVNLSQGVDDIFNIISFVNLLCATISICFFGFVAKIAREPSDIARNFLGVVATIVPIFNLCYYGQLLMSASEGIAESAYFNKWYQGNQVYQRMLCFLIVRAQHPCQLTSLRYAPITLNTFTTVMSTTWSYFSLASSVLED